MITGTAFVYIISVVRCTAKREPSLKLYAYIIHTFSRPYEYIVFVIIGDFLLHKKMAGQCFTNNNRVVKSREIHLFQIHGGSRSVRA